MIREDAIAISGLIIFVAAIISLISNYLLISWATWQTPHDMPLLIFIQVGLVIANMLLMIAGIALLLSSKSKRVPLAEEVR